MPQLLNTLASKEQVERTPSRQDGLPAAFEEELRAWGCQLIQMAGVLLRLPQVTMATAQVLFQRFWFVSSFAQFDVLDVAMGALFLASKLEETPKRIRDVINVFDYLIQRARHQGRQCTQSEECVNVRRKQLHEARQDQRIEKAISQKVFQYRAMSYLSDEYYDTKDALIVAEMQILKRLGFNVQVNLPYATMVNYLQLLGLAASRGDQDVNSGSITVAQHAWSILNDALQTPVYVLFPPHVLAAAAIYLTSLTLSTCPALPLKPRPWWELLDVSREELRTVSAHVLRLYGQDDQEGIASRIRQDRGGLVNFTSRTAVRDWLGLYGEDGSRYRRR